MGVGQARAISREWMDADEAMEALGVSRRTLQEYVQYELIEFEKVRRNGAGRQERLYRAADVQKIQKEGVPANYRGRGENPQETRAVRVPRASGAPAKLTQALETVSIVGQMVAALRADVAAQQERWKGDREDAFERFAEQRRQWEAEQSVRLQQLAPVVPLTEKGWLSLDEAVEVSGLSRGYLMGLIEREDVRALKAGPRGAWRIQRESLEGFQG